LIDVRALRPLVFADSSFFDKAAVSSGAVTPVARSAVPWCAATTWGGSP
jgi:hypothetical protein